VCFPTLFCAAADVAAVGGARTLAELSEVLLAARYDVSKLSTLELLRWDYKQAARPMGGGSGQTLAVGIAAICETVPELVSRSGGAAGLEAAMAEASARRGGLGLLFALTKEDPADANAKGLVVLLPTDAGTDAESDAGTALLEALEGVPALPEALATNKLFQAQQIGSEGFGIRWQAVEGAPRLRVSRLRAAATRKTLMPALLGL
jgi:hypothetical protein